MAKTVEAPVVVKIPNNAAAEKAAQLQVFVVDGSGNVIEQTPLKGGEAALSTLKDKIKGSRLFVAPALPKELPASKINVRTLTFAGAHEITQNFTAEKQITVAQLPGGIWQPPGWFWCKVRGNVNNTITLNGAPFTGPVCNARVHICNVERRYWWPFWTLPVIPANILAELKAKLKTIRIPVSPIPPLPDPAPRILGAVEKLSDLKPVLAANTIAAPLTDSVHAEIQAATTQNIRAIVSKYHDLLYPHLCLWPIYWDWFYYLSEETVVTTDCNGNFEGSIFRFPGYTENIYIWVEVFINGHWVTVYRPPFVCNTHWNYDCHTPINIHLADQDIPPCNCGVPMPSGSVWFTGIGNYGIALNIQQDVNHTATITQSVIAPNVAQTTVIRNVGCTNLVDSNQLAPFGSKLDFYLAFDVTKPSDGVRPATHYRWRRKVIKDAGLNNLPSPAPLTVGGPISRYYLWQDTVTHQWHSGSIDLHDTDANNEVGYKIPNFVPTSYPGVPANAEWDAFNFLSSAFDSNSVPDGYLAQFELELLYKDAANRFVVMSVPTNTFQVSHDTDYHNGSVPAPFTLDGLHNNYLTLDSSNNTKAVNLSLKVRIDNAQVAAHINEVQLLDLAGNPTGVTSGDCGFIIYSNPDQKVRISFVATEPFNFATFTFEVWKGSSGDIHPETQSGYVFSNVGIYRLSGGVYSADVRIADLLGTCHGKAAFGGYLWVHSLSTNGYTALWQYGGHYAASGNIAFALSNT